MDLIAGYAAGPALVADITYVPTTAAFVYLSVVLNAWSRRVAGGSMASHPKTKFVLGALDIALHQRQPEGIIHHSDLTLPTFTHGRREIFDYIEG